MYRRFNPAEFHYLSTESFNQQAIRGIRETDQNGELSELLIDSRIIPWANVKPWVIVVATRYLMRYNKGATTERIDAAQNRAIQSLFDIYAFEPETKTGLWTQWKDHVKDTIFIEVARFANANPTREHLDALYALQYVQGVDVNVRNDDGLNVLNTVCFPANTSADVVRVLLSMEQLDVNAHHNNTFHVLCVQEKPKLDIIRLFLNNKRLDIYAKHDGNTVFLQVSTRLRIECARLLLEKSDIDMDKKCDGYTGSRHRWTYTPEQRGGTCYLYAFIKMLRAESTILQRVRVQQPTFQACEDIFQLFDAPPGVCPRIKTNIGRLLGIGKHGGNVEPLLVYTLLTFEKCYPELFKITGCYKKRKPYSKFPGELATWGETFKHSENNVGLLQCRFEPPIKLEKMSDVMENIKSLDRAWSAVYSIDLDGDGGHSVSGYRAEDLRFGGVNTYICGSWGDGCVATEFFDKGLYKRAGLTKIKTILLLVTK